MEVSASKSGTAEEGGAMGGTTETGEGQSDGGKTLAPMPREWEGEEGTTRTTECKTHRGEPSVMDLLG